MGKRAKQAVIIFIFSLVLLCLTIILMMYAVNLGGPGT